MQVGGHGPAAGWRAWLVMALLLPVAAFAQGADELASTIEQSLSGIEYRIDLRPELAAQDLQEQQRRLALLEQQAPDHPELPALKQRFATLQAGIAASLADAAQEAATGTGAAQIPTAPEAFSDGLEQVGALQKQAESAYLIGETGDAADLLEQAEVRMATLEQRYGDQIPRGHAKLIVTKEKLAALKDQLAAEAGD
jgi:hypothetical protein